ncbi:MAG: cupredoxin domain-containing protein [Pseudolabrys sp.]|nr:cupredoxin domain-containing protein [Pseudolabrys sp.]
MKHSNKYSIAVCVAFLTVLAGSPGRAQDATLSVSVKNHQFQPAQITAKTNIPLSIRVKNLDSGRMEFESSNPRVEQVIGGNSEGIVKLGTLAPGRYEFYDDFDQRNTMVLVVR